MVVQQDLRCSLNQVPRESNCHEERLLNETEPPRRAVDVGTVTKVELLNVSRLDGNVMHPYHDFGNMVLVGYFVNLK
jgi:hypothetical protein